MADWFDSYQADEEGLYVAFRRRNTVRRRRRNATPPPPLCLNSCCFSYIENDNKNELTKNRAIVLQQLAASPTILWLIQSSLNDVGTTTTIPLFTFPFKKPSWACEWAFQAWMHCSKAYWDARQRRRTPNAAPHLAAAARRSASSFSPIVVITYCCRCFAARRPIRHLNCLPACPCKAAVHRLSPFALTDKKARKRVTQYVSQQLYTKWVKNGCPTKFLQLTTDC